MDKKIFKDILLLFGVIIIAAVGARILAGGETLADYAKDNPQAAESVSQSVNTESNIFQDTKNLTKTEVSSEEKNSQNASSNNGINDKGTADFSADSASKGDDFGVQSGTGITGDSADNEKGTMNSGKGDGNMSEQNVSPERVTYAEGFYYEPISNDVFKRISGISYPVDCMIPLDELRYVGVLYVDFDGETQSGEIICNKELAQDFVEIFSELYNNDYHIESIKLVDEFGGDDTASMLANNTSCFNYRVIPNTTRLSNHAKGRAIDINPFYNPYITYNKDGSSNISPEGSEPYADRSASFPYKIDENDLAYKLFTSHGFTWGGNWNSSKDYQHFEKK